MLFVIHHFYRYWPFSVCNICRPHAHSACSECISSYNPTHFIFVVVGWVSYILSCECDFFHSFHTHKLRSVECGEKLYAQVKIVWIYTYADIQPITMNMNQTLPDRWRILKQWIAFFSRKKSKSR